MLTDAFLASRPVSWINTAFPFAAAYLLTTREVDLIFVLGTLYFLIPYNLAMYGINDVFDYESDLLNPRKGGIEGALLDPARHRNLLILIAVTNIPFLIVLFVLGGPRYCARPRRWNWIHCHPIWSQAYRPPSDRFLGGCRTGNALHSLARASGRDSSRPVPDKRRTLVEHHGRDGTHR